MGQSIATHCRNCNHTEELITGIGFMYFSLQEVIPFTNSSVRTKLQEIVSNHTVTEVDYEHRVLPVQAATPCTSDFMSESFTMKVMYLRLHLSAGNVVLV